MKLKSVFPAIRLFIRAKEACFKPKKSAVLIYDREGAEDFYEYRDDLNYQIRDTRGESLNIFIVFLCILEKGVRFNFENFAARYVSKVGPKAVITFFNNTITFYRTKKYRPDAKLISVQNGHRDNELLETCFSNA